MTETIHLKIAGQVQGINLRYEVLQHAEKNGLKGWIRNEPDGKVTCCLECEANRLEQFINWLESKFKGISRIDLETVKEESCFENFIIKY